MDDWKESFHGGNNCSAYREMGCHFDRKGKKAVFRVYAPNAQNVSVVGDFNSWDKLKNVMTRITGGGLWECTVSEVSFFDGYKYYVESSAGSFFKSDPYAFHSETHSGTNSKVYAIDDGFEWTDSSYMKLKKPSYNQPMSIYEAHMGSWRKYPDGNYFDYKKFADEITPYLTAMNFTHLELMGIAEYPYDGSWGYQVTGYFAPTSRYGTPEDFKYLVNKLHDAGIGVILDWVPGHFPKNSNGLADFDGYPVYEPADELKKEHKEWGTRCFDYGRPEVRSFLISNAHYWLNVFHIDGLRVDAVASMLYLDYGRREWRPNKYGGHENLDAVAFFQQLNTAVFRDFPDALMIAEESTAWPLVTKPADVGGLGFNYKWNMGWMNDSLEYLKSDPIYRGAKHSNLTFSMMYAFSENYILPISHDEVVYGKCSLLNKAWGEYDMKFAGFRNFIMKMFSHPGKKLLYMGTEFAQFNEWNFNKELDWGLMDYPAHKSAAEFIKKVNGIYKNTPAFYEIEENWEGFEWLVVDDSMQNVLAYQRKDKAGNAIVCIFNFSPLEYKGYRVGAPEGEYETILSSNAGGFDCEPIKYTAQEIPAHHRPFSIEMNIAPMSGIYMKCLSKVKSTKKKSGDGKAASVKKVVGKERL